MTARHGSHVLVLKGKRGKAIFDKISTLKPESKEEIERKGYRLNNTRHEYSDMITGMRRFA